MKIRLAEKSDLGRVNELRKQVNDIHAEGKPGVFKPGFSKELQQHIYAVWEDQDYRIIAAEQNGVVCAFAVLRHIKRPEKTIAECNIRFGGAGSAQILF